MPRPATAPTYLTYQIAQGDSVRSLAIALLSQASAWTTIVAANGLRAPYISSLLRDQYGTPLASGVLGNPLPAGSTSVTLVLPSYLAQVGSIVFLETGTVGGTLTSDPLQIQSMTGTLLSLGRITSWSSLRRALIVPPGAGTNTAYPAGAAWTLYANPLLQTTAVAQPLESLLIPLDAETSAAAFVIGQSGAQAHLGTDLALDGGGQYQALAGGFSLVTGMTNMAQSLRMRVGTEVGDLLYHPEVGTRANTLVGLRVGPYLAHAYQFLLEEGILVDPRVQSVVLTVTVVGDVLSAHAEISIKETQSLVTLPALTLALT
ncbi:MAG: hypothetical protein NVSMB65_14350 [Chloroflexota bacterium]